jgi:hypothetical protein
MVIAVLSPRTSGRDVKLNTYLSLVSRLKRVELHSFSPYLPSCRGEGQIFTFVYKGTKLTVLYAERNCVWCSDLGNSENRLDIPGKF